MPEKLAIIHTTAVTIEPLGALAAEILPGREVLNFLDDSILPQLRRNGGDLEEVARRWLAYVEFARQAGADLVLSACSSVGELVPRAQALVDVPVLRIDEAMAEEAVRRGTDIGVAATLSTTLHPTLRLIRHKAAAAGKAVEIRPALIDSAFELLAAGDPEGHDRLLSQALAELAEVSDVVVLAQASMARVVPRLPDPLRDKFLSSPRLGLERAARLLEKRRLS